MILLYDAHTQLLKVRTWLILSLLLGAGAVAFGVHLGRTYGLNPGDGGELASLGERLAWAVGVSLIGLAMTGGLWTYSRCYIARVELHPETLELVVSTPSYFWNRKLRVDVSEIVKVEHHDGEYTTSVVGRRGLTVRAPWRSVRIAGKSLPLVLDEQGLFLHGELLEKLFAS